MENGSKFIRWIAFSAVSGLACSREDLWRHSIAMEKVGIVQAGRYDDIDGSYSDFLIV